MRSRYGGTPASEITETSRIDRLQVGQARRELRARAHAEPRIRARQMHLDGVDGKVERARDFLVRQPAGRELDDLALGRRQLAARPRPAAADALEVRPCPLRPAVGPELRERG